MDAESTKTWKRAVRFASGMVGAGAVQSVFDKFLTTIGEKAAPKVVEYATVKIFGPNSEDERKYEEALNLVPANWASRLTSRLALLTPSESDYYRITIMNEKVAVIAQTLERHARMDDVDWSNHIRVMNVHLEGAESQIARATAWAQTHLQDIAQSLDDDIQASGIIQTGTDVADAQRVEIRGLLRNLFGR